MMKRDAGMPAARSHRALMSALHLLLATNFLCTGVNALIYVQNDTYASLPGLFGKAMIEGRIYRARLQFLLENPFLCDPVDLDDSSFVVPHASTGGEVLSVDETEDRSGGGNQRARLRNLVEASAVPLNAEDDVGEGSGMNQDSDSNATSTSSSATTATVDPVILLAARGQCPFQRKAAVAENIDPSVQFLIVYNFNLDGEDTLVPMYSEFGDTRLVLLSVTHRAGQALKRYIVQHQADVAQDGGPIIQFDSTPPEGLLTVEDLRNMLLSALGLFFMLISLSGCVMIVAGTYGHLQIQGSRIVLSTDGGPVSAGGRALLTEDQVRQLALDKPGTAEDATCSTCTSRSSGGEPQVSCAVCIEDFSSDANVLTLPCQHMFHTDCIVPWLTERQSKCPLCKYDILEYVREKEAAASVNLQGETPSWRLLLADRLFRHRRWTRVVLHDGDNGGGISGPNSPARSTASSQSSSPGSNDGSRDGIMRVVGGDDGMMPGGGPDASSNSNHENSGGGHGRRRHREREIRTGSMIIAPEEMDMEDFEDEHSGLHEEVELTQQRHMVIGTAS